MSSMTLALMLMACLAMGEEPAPQGEPELAQPVQDGGVVPVGEKPGEEPGPTTAQYVTNGELITEGSEEAKRREAEFKANRIKKIEQHQAGQERQRGISFDRPMAEVDTSVVTDQIEGDFTGNGRNAFDTRSVKQLKKKGESTVGYPVVHVEQDKSTWVDLLMYWGLNLMLLGGIYAFCKSPYVKYLKRQPKPKVKLEEKKGKKRIRRKVESSNQPASPAPEPPSSPSLGQPPAIPPTPSETVPRGDESVIEIKDIASMNVQH